MDSRVWANYLSALKKKNSHSNGAQLTASYRVGFGELVASGSTAVRPNTNYSPTQPPAGRLTGPTQVQFSPNQLNDDGP